MYAVIKTGGKQHKVKAGDVLEIELTHTDGDTITFTPLLVVDDDGATHYGKEAAKAVVTAKLLGEKKGEKVKIFKYKPKTGYSKRQGHRQLYTLIEIEDVLLSGRRPSKKAEPKKEPKSEPKTEPKAQAEAQPEARADAQAASEVDAMAEPEAARQSEDVAIAETEALEVNDAPADQTGEAADASEA
jgi:large subunit ribosomal protein L21